MVATIAAQKTTGVRYVDANAPAGGNGLSWDTAARTIDEVSRNMNGGTIYVKPGVYGAFAYHEVSNDAEPLRIVATGSLEETVIDGAGNSAIVSLEANLPHELAPSPETPMLRLEGFAVRNMNVRACDQAFDRCVVSNVSLPVTLGGLPVTEIAAGPLSLVLKANGAATLTGTLPNKSKVSAAATLHVDAEGADAVRFYVKGAWIVWLPPAN